MKNNLFLFSTLIAFCMTFNACEKTYLTGSGSGSLAAIETNDKQLPAGIQLAIFQFAEIDKDGEKVKGWVVNRGGEIRLFETELTTWDPTALELDLSQLRIPANQSALYGEMLGQVAMEELVENYDNIEASYSDDIEMSISDPKDGSTAFIAYVKEEIEHNSPDDCPVESYGKQIVITIEGGVQLNNQTKAAKEILTWLKTVNEDIYD